ncbi:MAG: FAD-binding protein, partial [Burkholderiaceae bacterium]
MQKNVSLQAFNTFGIAARARELLVIRDVESAQAAVRSGLLRDRSIFILGGGSNIVLTADVSALVLKVEIPGMALVGETDRHWIVAAGAGVDWHEFVCWTVAQGWPGLENMALIPGVCGAAPV